MKLLIAIHHRFELWQAPAWFAERLKREFPQLQIVQVTKYEQVASEIGDAEVLIGWSLRGEQFLQALKLRWIHSTAAAIHLLLSPELLASKVVVTNAREVHAPVVAEHILAVMHALAKRFPAAARYQQQRIWAQTQMWRQGLQEISGSTLGLVGLGSIGGETARRALGVGMRVFAMREHPEKASDVAERIFGPEQLDEMLGESDFVALAAPLTPRTEHIINEQRLAKMKPSSYLINVSRGPLIDDAALIAALRQKKIAGAALDVFSEEPLPADSPYWSLENCLVTPHTAAITDRMWERHYALFTDNLRHYMAGQPLRGIVNTQQGY